MECSGQSPCAMFEGEARGVYEPSGKQHSARAGRMDSFVPVVSASELAPASVAFLADVIADAFRQCGIGTGASRDFASQVQWHW